MKEKQSSLNSTPHSKLKLLLYKSNFPSEDDLEDKKRTMKAEGTFQFLTWRKFLTSNNLYLMKYKFDYMQMNSFGLSLGLLYLAFFW
jgi:hypothetical protein